MKGVDKKQKDKRRQFLKRMVALGGSAAVAVMSKGAAASEHADKPSATPVSKGYQETRHVRDYYEKARF